MLVNSNTFNIKSTITDDWGSSHRVAIDLEALSQAQDWKFEIALDGDYSIGQIYGANLTESSGKTYLSGSDWNQSLEAGENTEIILIVDEGNSSNQAPILPQLLFANSLNSAPINSNTFDIQSTITDDWGSSHRVAIDLEALSQAQDWKFEIALDGDYSIGQIYGANLTESSGKTYLSGSDWNQSLEAGENTEIILIVDEGNSSNQAPILPQLLFANSLNSAPINSNTFDIQSTITDDWGSSHRVAIDLEALSPAQDWKFEIALDGDYSIGQIYGANLTESSGKTYLSGSDWNQSLEAGENTEIILIVDEGNSSNQAPILPQLLFVNSLNSAPINSNTFDIQSTITDDWGSSHRVAIDLEALSPAQDWKFEIALDGDYSIGQIYGANLTESSGKTYLSGSDWNQSLEAGENTEIILIVDEGNSSNQAPILPQFFFNQIASPNNNVVNNQNDKIINVETDFGGNLVNAIAAANDGDSVQLGNKTYYTDGITVNKDITITGQSDTVINGISTSKPIINLTSGASGATIQNLEITNGDTGIYGYSVFDLTLNNLQINNIGIDPTIRDGQNNTGIVLNRADGLQIFDSYIHNIGRKGIGVNDTDGAYISGLTIEDINLAAQHSQSFDAAGIKFFNTNQVTVSNSNFSNNNAIDIWNDTTNATTINDNLIKNVGQNFLSPDFDSNTSVTGIYNEKSSNAIIQNNEITSVGRFIAFNATEFSTETMTLIDNNFSSFAVNTQDYWVNESIEKLIAVTEDPGAADFSLFEDQYFAQANIG